MIKTKELPKRVVPKKLMGGAAMIETIVVFPVMLFLGLGIVHLALIYQAKTNLEYASFMAARQASVIEMGSASIGPTGENGLELLKRTVRCRMEAYDPLPTGVICNGTRLPADEIAKVQIHFLNPTSAAFLAWGVDSSNNGCSAPNFPNGCVIPNNNLIFQSPTATNGGITLQDATIVRLGVRYFVNTGVPFMNNHFIGEKQSTDLEDLYPNAIKANLGNNRTGIWVKTDSTIRMQSSPTISTVNVCALSGYC